MRASIILGNVGIATMLAFHDMWFIAGFIVVGTVAALFVD